MSFVSYAQNFEDIMLYRAFKDVEHGFYVDVGAHDPLIDSVTKAFYERGWSGVNIEPVRQWYVRLQEDRPRDVNLQLAVSSKQSTQEMFEFVDTGLSTLDEAVARKHQEQGYEMKRSWIDTQPLNRILEAHAPEVIHFLKIDVEGMEGEVLKGIDLDRWRPKIIVVEATEPLAQEGSHHGWHDLIGGHEYDLAYFDGLNRFYVAEECRELALVFQLPPNVFDNSRHYRLVSAEERAESERRGRMERDMELKRSRSTQSRLEHELAMVYASRSWRVTRPLRRAKEMTSTVGSSVAYIARKYVRCIKLPIQRGILGIVRFIAVRPGLRQVGLNFVRCVPGAESRLRKLWVQQGELLFRNSTEGARWNRVWGEPKSGGQEPKVREIPQGLLINQPEDESNVAVPRRAGRQPVEHPIRSIHQFSHGSDSGDGITRSMLFTQRLLRELGFRSEIYCGQVPASLADELRPMTEFSDSKDAALLVHHSMGHEEDKWIMSRTVPKVLVYHNITPPSFFEQGSTLEHYSHRGREQLSDWVQEFDGAIADSSFNRDELVRVGYEDVETISLLVDLKEMLSTTADRATTESLRAFENNILFVGRISENKCQLELVEVLNHLRAYIERPVHLHIVGGVTSPAYHDKVAERVQEYGLESFVHIAGKVDEATLRAYYREVDLFLCLSEHEGFGMPLIESMVFDTPVIAYGAGAVPATVGGGGLVLAHKDPDSIAKLVAYLLNDRSYRRQVIKSQRNHLQRFEPSVIQRKLADFLARLGITPFPRSCMVSEDETFTDVDWRIEGPFDSSYSLALLNRETARALSALGDDVVLHSMDGGKEFEPDERFLDRNPDLREMHLKGKRLDVRPRIVSRNLYPPRVAGMKGEVNIVHHYAWEESGFPDEWIEEFNRQLDGLTCLSRHVQKILTDHGLTVPTQVTGCGVDHWERVESAKGFRIQAKSFRFIHVSSCFPRKGIDVLLNAYGASFRSEDDVSLVIKTFPNPHNDLEQQLLEFRQKDPGYPDVVVINGDMSSEELKALYEQCHALVAPSRAEGFGLPIAEAMVTGLPVITTNWGGQRDFCDESTAWVVDYRFERARSHFDLFDSVWAEPDVADLSARLVELYRSTTEDRLERIQRARQRIWERFTWRDVAERLMGAEERIRNEKAERAPQRVGWVSTWNARCGIATYSAHLVGHMSDELTIFAARTGALVAEDGENVVRCWDNSGEDSLLELEEAVEKCNPEVVVIQFNYGFFDFGALDCFIKEQKRCRRAVIVVLHSTVDPNGGPPRKRLASLHECFSECDRILVHSVSDLNRLKRLGHVDNVTLFPHGVAEIEARDIVCPAPELRTVIASYGFFLPHKGLVELIDAVARCVSRGHDIHLVLVNSEYPVAHSRAAIDAAERRIRALGMEDRVYLETEFLTDEESVGILQHSDLIVFPYQETGESASGAVRFGLASGRPVAVTPLPIFEDVEAVTFKLPGSSVEEIADGLNDILSRSDNEWERVEEAQHRWRQSHAFRQLGSRLSRMIASCRQQESTSYTENAFAPEPSRSEQ